MLQELRIKNFAIIDEVDLTFSRGFNVLTGETGAGKSIILNAVHLLLGDKATDELVRASAEEASVEALFDLSGNRSAKERVQERLPGKGTEDDLLLIRRVVSRSGRSKVFLNGTLATLGMLSEIGEDLLSLYGQHEHQTLQRVETHVDILDAFGELESLRQAFEKRFQEFSSLSQEIRRIREEKEKGRREQDLMTFQSKEIEAARLQVGEEEALKEERTILSHAKRLVEFAHFCEEALYGEEGSAIGRIQLILRQGRDVMAIDPALAQMLKGLDVPLIQLEETALALRDYARGFDLNPMRLEEIENRLEELDRLKKKYGSSLEEILQFKVRIDGVLQSLNFDEERLTELENRMDPLRQEMNDLAERLSSERKKAGAELKRSVERELGSLGMKRTTFEVQMDPAPLASKGADRVEFLISPNVGEAVKPLAKIASGGELSRIMLATKKILAKVGGRQVLIFDEVDSGIGGAIAEVVGRKLKDLSKQHQVICVTHLPQIASFADAHHSVKKEVKGGRTRTIVERLEKEGIVEEVARMLGGVKVTEKTKSHAREMLENAQKT